jgi:hypothetical protein
MADTDSACTLLELRWLAGWRAEPVDFFHYRDSDDFEVDNVWRVTRLSGLCRLQ